MIISQNLLLAFLMISTTGMFSMLVASTFLKTPLTLKTCCAIVISFVGIAIVIGPTTGYFSWATCLGLLSGFFNACAQLTLFYTAKCKQQDPVITVFVICSLGTVLALLMIPATATVIPVIYTGLFSSKALWFLLAGAVCGLYQQIMRGRAYQLVNEPTSLTPFFNSAIVYAGLIDCLRFNQLPSLSTCLGCGLVITSGIIMSKPNGIVREDV